ncbi:kinase-like domain-containing protein, partial [Umbelopsis sp. AD052]
VNKHWYTVLDQLGKGGTGRVWRVMSHTHHRVFALKHVSLADVDSEATISSYINEIRLLERLSGHSRIVKLYDYEVNQQNGYIQMILECGELDMNTLLAKQQGKPINLNFIRMYWEQMLEAVHAIHQQKIVHSDLKPANFILVQGALKLIDFGIAKAIPNDTTNIQRDIQVGTLNYMSPEAIKDSQAGQHGGREMMKLGRPSDVWSLGCILYQMVYGRTPFHHVKGMWQKLACISNPSHEIEFPKIANGVRVEADLLNVMKYCLQRDPKQRKTIPQLLKDPFIKPDQVLKQLYEHAYKQGSAGQPLDADSMDKAIEVRDISQ